MTVLFEKNVFEEFPLSIDVENMYRLHSRLINLIESNKMETIFSILF